MERFLKGDAKFCFLDVETTGLDVYKCDIWQLAAIITIGGEVVDKKNFLMAPSRNALIIQTALDLQGLSEDYLWGLPEREKVFKDIKKFLGRFVSKYDKFDKFFPIGYNVNFDMDFMRKFWEKQGDRYFGSYFTSASFDVMGLVGYYAAITGTQFKNFKLVTACEHFNIPLDAHDASSDIEATRTLFLMLKSYLGSFDK